MACIGMRNSIERYRTGSAIVAVGDNVFFTVDGGDSPSFSARPAPGVRRCSTFLDGMDANISGRVIIDGRDVSDCTLKQVLRVFFRA